MLVNWVKKALLAIGIEPSKATILLDNLEEAGIERELYYIEHEPTIGSVREGMQLARKANCDIVISFGGGSAIDCGKAISAMLTNKGDILDYLEVIGKGKPIVNPPVPFIAVPTTSGTGAQVTRNAVINSRNNMVKVSLRSPKMLPDIALIDPELTVSMPPEITGETGMDALTQVIEP
jgi:alcohol dehydrogenase class IV